jgi:hypothetical protein
MEALARLVGTLFATAILFISLVLMAQVIDSFETGPFCSSSGTSVINCN